MHTKTMLAICSLAALFSCSTNQQSDSLLTELSQGLTSATNYARRDAANTMEAFKLKLVAPATKERAELWYPRMQRVWSATSDLTKFIDSLKQLVQPPTNGDGNSNDKSKSVDELLIDNGLYKDLYKRLIAYREQVLFTDSMRLDQLKNHITIISKEQDTAGNDALFKQHLTTNPPLGTLAYLNLLQNNLVVAQAKCLEFYNEQVIDYSFWFDSYEAILGQNAKLLNAGDWLEISGGVGSFSKQRLLEFLVDGKKIEPDERGLVIYKFKTSKKLGNYTVPVHVRLLDEDSTEQTRTFTVNYTLVEAIKKQ